MTQALDQPLTAQRGVADECTGSLWLGAATLWRREMVRFFRQRSRVVGALATPVVFWLLLGSGLNHSFVLPGADGGIDAAAPGYMEFFFPGTIVLMLLFTAIFSTISVIEDRREGFLQGVLVAPVPRLAIALGKVLGGASIATIQGVLLLALWPLVGHWPGWVGMSAAVGMMLLLSIGLTGMSLCIAWPMDSTAGFHAVMNLFMMPMWFLSGAVFPITEKTPALLRWIVWTNPLTYGQSAFTSALRLKPGQSLLAPAVTAAPSGFIVSMLVTAAFAVAMLALATRLVNRPRKDGTL